MSNDGNGTGGSDIDSFGDASQRLDVEHAALLHSKQAKLDVIENRHDDLCVLTFFIARTRPLVRVGDSACVLMPIVYRLCRYVRHSI